MDRRVTTAVTSINDSDSIFRFRSARTGRVRRRTVRLAVRFVDIRLRAPRMGASCHDPPLSIVCRAPGETHLRFNRRVVIELNVNVYRLF